MDPTQGLFVMSTKPEWDGGGFSEPCKPCGRETPHRVRLEVRSAKPTPESQVHAREPLRIATCRVCGEDSIRRMSKL